MKSVSGKEMCKILERKGWVHLRTQGSHHIYQKPGVGNISVPVHASKSLKPGTQRKIMKQAGLNKDDL